MKKIEINTSKIGTNTVFTIDGVGIKGPHVIVRGNSVKLIDDEGNKRNMTYVGSAIKNMVDLIN